VTGNARGVSGHTTVWAPVVRFKASRGQLRQPTSPIPSKGGYLQVGTSVSLRYNPRDPSQFVIDDPRFVVSTAGRIGFVLGGSIALLAGFLLLLANPASPFTQPGHSMVQILLADLVMLVPLGGAWVLVQSLSALVQRWRDRIRGRHATGRVVELLNEERPVQTTRPRVSPRGRAPASTAGRAVLVPIIEHARADGVLTRFADYTAPDQVALDDQVTVFFDPEVPLRRQTSWPGHNPELAALKLALMGSVVVVMGAITVALLVGN